MRIKMKKLLLIVALIVRVVEASSEQSDRFQIGTCFCPEAFAVKCLKYKDGSFFVKDKDGSHQVKNHDLCKEVRGLPEDKLCNLLQHGYLAVNKAGNDYTLTFRPRLQGGGVAIARALYVGTKTACYGIIAGVGVWMVRKATKKVKKVTKAQSDTALAIITVATTAAEKMTEAAHLTPMVPYTVEVMNNTAGGAEIAQGVVGVSTIAVAEGTKIVSGNIAHAIEVLATFAYGIGLMIPGP